MPERFEATPGRLDVVVTALDRRPARRRAAGDRRRARHGRRRRAPQVVPAGRATRSSRSICSPTDRSRPTRGRVPVRYRDEHLVVVVKPAGVITHPTATHRAGTLVNRLLGMGVPLATGGWRATARGSSIVWTWARAGLMLVASSDAAFAGLRAQLKRPRDRSAVPRARPRRPRARRRSASRRRSAVARPRIIVDRVEGRAAATAFEVQERLPRTALVEAAPRTGRTHQIRVHLQAIGHPIVGDRSYGGGGDEARRLGLRRPFLHSWRLAFDHPITGERARGGGGAAAGPRRMPFGSPAPTCALDAPMAST